MQRSTRIRVQLHIYIYICKRYIIEKAFNEERMSLSLFEKKEEICQAHARDF